MLIHLFHLLGRALAQIPLSLGSTWLGILFPIVVAIVGELIGVVRYGWQAMIQNWQKATRIGMTALVLGYAGLYLFCLISVIYTDHINLVTTVSNLGGKLSISENTIASRIQAVESSKDAEIQQLRIDCAYKSGASGILKEQLTTQQNQLNSCILQQKQNPQFSVFPVSHSPRQGLPAMEYVLISNTVRSPVDLYTTCNFAISDAEIRPMTTGGGSADMSDKRKISDMRYKLTLLSPAWSPAGPVWVTVYFVPPVNSMPSCSFSEN